MVISDDKTFFCLKIQIEKDADWIHSVSIYLPYVPLILGQLLDLKSPPKLKLSQYWWDIWLGVIRSPAWRVFISWSWTKTDFFDPLPPHLLVIEWSHNWLCSAKNTWTMVVNRVLMMIFTDRYGLIFSCFPINFY